MNRPAYLAAIESMLERIRSEHRYRELPSRQLSGVVDFSSNDYLGLAGDPQVVAALRNATRAGSGGARLLGGRHREHSLLEEELAAWLGRERALLFSSGYHAAIGAIPALAPAFDAIYSDERNHASLIDGVRLSRVARVVYPRGAPPVPQEGVRALVVGESLHGMDGDVQDPSALLERLGAGGALLLDEAHALGVLGAQGAGLAGDLRDERVLVMGTLSKALGSHGGFVAGPAPAIELLVNRARSFVFDTALPPALALAARIGIALARRAGDRRAALAENARRLRRGLRDAGLDVPDAPGPIVAPLLGSEERALRLCAALLERRIYVPAIRPPTVPPGTSRLRFSVRSDHRAEQIDLAVEEVRACIATS
ncbi:MAG TPA: aminotransferase class I/II-fold pyridoxal phosphate-dependent enzyme [Verrucomicrobiae bacterium]|nr:aminotransferase class I/II-fold pyridoxal phosphate-dependent enzyme [Verrucomicrobiae bacterium]